MGLCVLLRQLLLLCTVRFSCCLYSSDFFHSFSSSFSFFFFPFNSSSSSYYFSISTSTYSSTASTLFSSISLSRARVYMGKPWKEYVWNTPVGVPREGNWNRGPTVKKIKIIKPSTSSYLIPKQPFYNTDYTQLPRRGQLKI